METIGTSRVTELHELEEFRFQAFESTRLYKERMKIHDKHVLDRSFKPRDLVLLYNSRLRLFLGKLKSRLSGPFRVVQVFPSGVIEIVGQSRIRNLSVPRIAYHKGTGPHTPPCAIFSLPHPMARRV